MIHLPRLMGLAKVNYIMGSAKVTLSPLKGVRHTSSPANGQCKGKYIYSVTLGQSLEGCSSYIFPRLMGSAKVNIYTVLHLPPTNGQCKGKYIYSVTLGQSLEGCSSYIWASPLTNGHIYTVLLWQRWASPLKGVRHTSSPANGQCKSSPIFPRLMGSAKVNIYIQCYSGQCSPLKGVRDTSSLLMGWAKVNIYTVLLWVSPLKGVRHTSSPANGQCKGKYIYSVTLGQSLEGCSSYIFWASSPANGQCKGKYIYSVTLGQSPECSSYIFPRLMGLTKVNIYTVLLWASPLKGVIHLPPTNGSYIFPRLMGSAKVNIYTVLLWVSPLKGVRHTSSPTNGLGKGKYIYSVTLGQSLEGCS